VYAWVHIEAAYAQLASSMVTDIEVNSPDDATTHVLLSNGVIQDRYSVTYVVLAQCISDWFDWFLSVLVGVQKCYLEVSSDMESACKYHLYLYCSSYLPELYNSPEEHNGGIPADPALDCFFAVSNLPPLVYAFQLRNAPTPSVSL